MKQLILFIFILVSVFGQAQKDSTLVKDSARIKVKGSIIENKSGTVLFSTYVIRQGYGGTFADYNGEFEISLNKSDTIIISCLGYAGQKFCFADSVGEEFRLDVQLKERARELAEHTVFPKRKLSKIHDDLENVKQSDLKMPKLMDYATSPISALYNRFSKIQQSKRLVAELEYQDKKEALLKELFRVYVDADIINLSEDEFEKFIAFCNVSDYFLRSASEYQLIAYFQNRYREYLKYKLKVKN